MNLSKELVKKNIRKLATAVDKPYFTVILAAVGLSCAASAATIRDYGATGNGSTDDTAAIQRAIDSTPTGGILYFPAGTYRVSSALLFRSNRTYQGQNNPVLLGYQGTGSGGYFLGVTEYNGTANLTIDAITFDGGGISFQGQETPATNIRFTNNTVRNIVNSSTNWALRRGVFIPSGMRQSTIAYNTFYNIQAAGLADLTHTDGSSISGWRVDTTSITDNHFDTVNQGISLQFDSITANPGPFSNVTIARNVGTNVHRMGVETQSTTAPCNNMLVEDNSFSNYRNPYNDSFGYSIVHGGSGAIVRRNVAIATPMAVSGQRFGFGFEIAGDNVTVDSNTVSSPLGVYQQGSWWYGIIMGNGSNILVQNNTLCGPGNSTNIGFEVSPPPTSTIRNNTITASCSTSTGDTTAPSVSISSPTSGATLAGTATVSATASDNVAVAKVDFLMDGTLLGTSTSAPYSFAFGTTNFTNGSHSLTARASDAAGNQATSAAIGVQISNAVADTTAPTVTLTSPASGATVSGSITLAATASDNVGVTAVKFLVDNSAVGSSSTAPYTFALNTTGLINGVHTLAAQASDAAGNLSAVSSITVQVSNLATPSAGTPVTNGLRLWLKADAGITLQGSTVAKWADQSGNGTSFDQTTTANQPAFIASAQNGRPSVGFDGVRQFLSGTLGINGLTGMTMFLVSSATKDLTGGSSQSESAAIFWDETLYWGATYISPFQTRVNFRYGTTQSGNNPLYLRPASAGTAYTMTTSQKNGTTDSLYVNGNLVISQGGKLNAIKGTTNTAYLGRGYNNTYFPGRIAEVLVYTRALSDSERQSVEAYLKSKYGL